MANRWIVLQHVAWEGPGLIAAEARARGLEVRIQRLDLEQQIPSAGDIDGLVVMGGPMGAYETGIYPFLANECSVIAELARRGRPVLGVCLGAQLLAQALGARVYPGPAAEIGFGSVDLTAEARQDSVFGNGAAEIPVFHWHGDTFDLPSGATLLAGNSKYAHQAFRFGQCAYALQFHVEPDAETWRAWEPHLPAGALAGTTERREQIQKVGKELIAGFFDLAISVSDSRRR